MNEAEAAKARLDELQPLFNEYAAWAARGDTDSEVVERAKMMVRHTTQLRRASEFAAMVYAAATEADAPGGTVTGLFEHKSRNHPSRWQRDDCPPHGIPRYDTEREALAREEHAADVTMGRYWPDPSA